RLVASYLGAEDTVAEASRRERCERRPRVAVPVRSLETQGPPPEAGGPAGEAATWKLGGEDIWFDDVDPADIEAALGPEAAQIARKRLGQSESSIALVKEQAFGGLTRALAIDCEMVGVGPEGEESVAARVSIVNQHGKCVYDKCIKPTQPVTDYRTAVSGIRPENLKQGGSSL
ncbi:RNA exonuclease 4-like, partial [Herpailurus yagouaroundi]|uniref:RNA exonuclease 4-like n=1 Tax=Herpailurus yagouaroundi TaxID=1608482 RepID=UPI001AD66E2B